MTACGCLAISLLIRRAGLGLLVSLGLLSFCCRAVVDNDENLLKAGRDLTNDNTEQMTQITKMR